MTGTKTLSELDILRLAASAITAKVSKYLEAKARTRDELEIYNIIEEYDNQLGELYERIEELEKKEKDNE